MARNVHDRNVFVALTVTTMIMSAFLEASQKNLVQVIRLSNTNLGICDTINIDISIFCIILFSHLSMVPICIHLHICINRSYVTGFWKNYILHAAFYSSFSGNLSSLKISEWHSVSTTCCIVSDGTSKLEHRRASNDKRTRNNTPIAKTIANFIAIKREVN